MSFIDSYRKSWALRCLREAKVNMMEARERKGVASLPLIASAIKKAQTAIYYGLGDPSLIDPIIRSYLGHPAKVGDPILHFLVGIESTLSSLATPAPLEGVNVMGKAEGIITATDRMIKLILKEAAGS
ncbi:MAG: hypothetical protein ACE5OY_04530 [Candidatus Bathyarchaeia archaeon]